jgi:hypothetical protein
MASKTNKSLITIFHPRLRFLLLLQGLSVHIGLTKIIPKGFKIFIINKLRAAG